MGEERLRIVKDVLDRMDEICPMEDIDMVTGELVDSILDNALTEYTLLANVHRIPICKKQRYPYSDLSRSRDKHEVKDGVFEVPNDFLRLISVSSPEIYRELYESDLLDTSSNVWKMSFTRLNHPTRMKPMIAVTGEKDGLPVYTVRPCVTGEITLTYAYKTTPEKVREILGSSHGYYQSYVWYAAYSVLTVMVQPDNAAVALQHMQSYQIIPKSSIMTITKEK